MSYRDRRFGGGRRFGGPKPVEIGKEYDVEITEISRQGDGIARVQGFVIFVKGATAGQKPRIRITNVGERFATAQVANGEQQNQQQLAEEGAKVSNEVVSPLLEDKAELHAKNSEDQSPTG
jgi:predicted RNA-binding protein with TRAM domain